MRPPRRRVLPPMLLLLGAAVARAGEPAPAALPRQSPFLPPGASGAGPAAAPAEALEFAGVTSVGRRTDLMFHDKEAKRTLWVGLGETKAGLQVVGYDARREQAIVKVNGVDKVLPLRRAGKAPGAGAPAAVSPAPDAPPPGVVFAQPFPGLDRPHAVGDSPTTLQPVPPAETPAAPPQRQEAEARMLVSDLLEIGMAQRRAYEEAQRRLAEGQTPPASPPAEPKP